MQQVSGNTLQQVKFKYLSSLRVVFTSYGNRNKGIDTRITTANTVLLELCFSCFVAKTGAFKDRKAVSF